MKTQKTPSKKLATKGQNPRRLAPVPGSPRSSRVITLPNSGVFNNDLSCNLRGIAVHRDAVILFLPKGDCCDMSGAIRLAATIHPKCKRVVSISGDAVDRVYQLKAGNWKSFVVAADHKAGANDSGVATCATGSIAEESKS